ncbi:MAG: redoxin domain-containing protein [Anaerolineales bacterium]
MSGLLNRLAPDFILPSLTGNRVALSEWRGFVVVINFWSAECAWSRRADVMLVYRQLTWHAKGVRVMGIACNVNESQTEVGYEVERRRVKYPVLFDIEHRVADLYKAETTPHFFVLDRQGVVRYLGAQDDATSRQREAKTHYLDRAVEAVLDGRLPNPALTQPYGCAIIRQMPGDSPSGANPQSARR